MKLAVLLAGICALGLSFALRTEASSTAEGYDGKAAAAFDLLNEIAPFSLNIINLSAFQARPASQPSAPEPARKTIHLRGPITLTGSAYVPFGAAVVTLVGNGQVQDDSGHFSEEVRFTWTQTFPVLSSFISGVAEPTVSVQISKDGQVLGNVQLRGMIPVSGTDLSHMVSLSGSGFMEGEGEILDPASVGSR